MSFVRNCISRRPRVGALVLMALLCWIAPISAQTADDEVATAVARQNIEYLRRQYARATDLIGLNTEQGMAEGLTIYRRVFTDDVEISSTDDGETLLSATGPKAWAEVAAKALEGFDNTQHLIGTQLVQIHSMPDSEGRGGKATMTSYLQAWHDDPDRVLDVFIGTYHDKVRYTPGVGWQIYEMRLEKVSGEVTDK